MADGTRAQKRLISYILKHHPELKEKEIPEVLNGIRLFVNLTRKIYTEPQARISYKDNIDKETKKKKKQRIFDTNFTELKKVREGSIEPIGKVFQKFHKLVTKSKYD